MMSTAIRTSQMFKNVYGLPVSEAGNIDCEYLEGLAVERNRRVILTLAVFLFLLETYVETLSCCCCCCWWWWWW